MACEKPVVSTELPGVKRATGDGVMYARDANDYKERILELHGNNGLRYDMGKEGRRLVEAGYDWEKIVERMEKDPVDGGRKTRGSLKGCE